MIYQAGLAYWRIIPSTAFRARGVGIVFILRSENKQMKVKKLLKDNVSKEGFLLAALILMMSAYVVSTKVAFADGGIFGIFEGIVSTVYADFMGTITPVFVLAFVFSVAGWAVFPNKRVSETCKNAVLVILVLYVVLLLVVPLFSYLKSLVGEVSTDITGL